MKYYVSVTRVKKSKIENIDFSNIPLGRTFTDHTFVCDYNDGKWINPRVEPLQLIPMHPAAMSLHYGQAIFEGMKATRNENGQALLFRPEKNAERLNFSADRLGMPSFPEELFVDGLKKLVATEKNWIPSEEGSALYLRPFMFATEPFIGMRAANQYKFMIIATPAGPFFTKRIKIWAEQEYTRCAKGGTGEAKAAGNYAAAIRPTEMAKQKGYDQVLWLDPEEHKFVQEAGTMNMFFVINDKVVTPKMNGTILNGITRDSIITILKQKGYQVEERPITITEIRDAARFNLLKEAFGTGTAVGVAMIEEINYDNSVIPISEDNPIGQMVFDELNGIKIGKIDDPFNWMVKVDEVVPKITSKKPKSVFRFL